MRHLSGQGSNLKGIIKMASDLLKKGTIKGLYVGGSLWCKNGEEVVVSSITEDTIEVIYGGKKHSREIGIIGKKLFLKNPTSSREPSDVETTNHRTTIGKPSETASSYSGEVHNKRNRKNANMESLRREQRTEQRTRKCSDCLLQRRGDCFGQKQACEDFKYAPSHNKELEDNWPKYGDATWLRMHSFKGKK